MALNCTMHMDTYQLCMKGIISGCFVVVWKLVGVLYIINYSETVHILEIKSTRVLILNITLLYSIFLTSDYGFSGIPNRLVEFLGRVTGLPDHKI